MPLGKTGTVQSKSFKEHYHLLYGKQNKTKQTREADYRDILFLESPDGNIF